MEDQYYCKGTDKYENESVIINMIFMVTLYISIRMVLRRLYICGDTRGNTCWLKSRGQLMKKLKSANDGSSFHVVVHTSFYTSVSGYDR